MVSEHSGIVADFVEKLLRTTYLYVPSRWPMGFNYLPRSISPVRNKRLKTKSFQCGEKIGGLAIGFPNVSVSVKMKASWNRHAEMASNVVFLSTLAVLIVKVGLEIPACWASG